MKVFVFVLSIFIVQYTFAVDTIDCGSVRYEISPNLARFFEDTSFKPNADLQIAWGDYNPVTKAAHDLNSAESKQMTAHFQKVVSWVQGQPEFEFIGQNVFKNIGTVYIAVRSDNRKAVKALLCAMPDYGILSAAFEGEVKLPL